MSATAEDAGEFFRATFRRLGEADSARAQRSYMKSELKFYGINARILRSACREYLASRPALAIDELWPIVDALLESDEFDLRSAAIGLLERRHRDLQPRHLPRLLNLVRRGACWAHVDWVATRLVASVLQRHPQRLAVLERWAADRDFWVRRAALLAQLPQLRAGQGDFQRFERLAVPMLPEKEFFIRKAIGWVLREVSKKRPALVRSFIRVHGAHASTLTLREARKYL